VRNIFQKLKQKKLVKKKRLREKEGKKTENRRGTLIKGGNVGKE